MKAKKVPSCRVEANGGDSSLAGHDRRLRVGTRVFKLINFRWKCN